jgi:hypothetical protein
MNYKRDARLPEPTGGVGAFFYAVAGGLTVAVILAVLHHVHLTWTR